MLFYQASIVVCDLHSIRSGSRRTVWTRRAIPNLP